MLGLSMGNSNKIKVAILLLNDDDLRDIYTMINLWTNYDNGGSNGGSLNLCWSRF